MFVCVELGLSHVVVCVTMAANAKKRTTLTFAAKLEAIQRVENGEKKSSVAEAFGIPRSTLSTLLKNKGDIKAKAEKSQHSGAWRVRKAAFEDVEKSLHKWFIDARARNIPISGPMLQQKAKNFAFILGAENFNASSGWLQRFKTRFDIVGKTVSGESEDANDEEIQKWLDHEWPKVLAKYEPNQIFNADETGLFWQMLPRQTLDTRGDKCHGGKQGKARVTVLLAANMDGSTKLRPLVIGKFQTPRCMRNCPNIPVTYAWNKKSWMTRDIFLKWLKAWDSDLARQGRKVCLIVDNCTAHHTDAQLSNIEVVFLPPNTTSKLQPLDQGIIRTFKSIYKHRLIEILLVKLRMGQDLKIDLLGAIEMPKASWDNVKQSTIANCFQHAGFAGCTDEASVEESEEAGLACADEESELAETWSKLESFVGAEPQSMCIDDFVGGDDSTGTTAELTDVEIVAEVTAEQPNENAAEMDPASADDAPLPTSAEVIAALALVRRHCGAIEGTDLSLVDRLDYIEDAVVKHAIANKKQATLFQYFKPTQ